MQRGSFRSSESGALGAECWQLMRSESPVNVTVYIMDGNSLKPIIMSPYAVGTSIPFLFRMVAIVIVICPTVEE